jgi:hypothetical protein
MKSSVFFKMTIVLLVTCITLSGIIGMAGAVNGMRTNFPSGAQPLAAGGTGTGGSSGTLLATRGPATGGQATTPSTLLATGGPQIGGVQGAGGGVGTPYATGGPSRCVGNMCTADWVGTGGPLIGSGTGTVGSQVMPSGTSGAGTGSGIGVNIPAGTGVQGRDYSQWYARCAGIAGPGNDPMCRLGSPQSPYTTGGLQTGGVQGAGGTPSTLFATGGPQIGSAGQGTGGTSGTLLYQLQPGDTRIGGVQG